MTLDTTTAEKTLEKPNARFPNPPALKRGLVNAGIDAARVEISEIARLAYTIDVGPISLMPQAVIDVHSHGDVEKAVRFAAQNSIAINARGSGSGLPGQSVGSGIVLDMRSMTESRVLEDHPDGGKVVLAQAGVNCTRLNNMLKEHGVFLASYPASTDMATLGGMIANNSSGANSCKLGTTQHQVLDLHVVLADGTSVWTSEIDSESAPWSAILDVIEQNGDVIEKRFPRVPKNSSGYNVLDILHQRRGKVPVDWTRIFAHSEGTLGIVTEAKIRALPLATRKATCIVYFTDLQQACGAIPEIYDLGPSCFDTAVTTNLDLIRKTYPDLGIPEQARVMYIIEFDDIEVKPDPADPARRIGNVRLMQGDAAARLIDSQVSALRKLIESKYAATALGFDVATDAAKQDAFWIGRRSALQVLYGYDPKKRPLTMIECVVIPRDEKKLLDFISFMERVFEQEQVVAGTHGHAGDCNFHIYLLLNLSEKEDRRRLISVMTEITRKVTELGGSMSGEHADGRTRGIILPYVFGRELFDVFVKIKQLLDPAQILHPGVKIISEARDMDLHDAIEKLVGIEENQSQLNLGRFRDLGHLYSGFCSVCSQCAESCPVYTRMPEEFSTRTQAAPTFKRILAVAMDGNSDLKRLKKDPQFKKAIDLCLMCGSCTYKCSTNASMRDVVMKFRAEHPNRILAPLLYSILMPKGWIYRTGIKLAGLTQVLWNNPVSRAAISLIPSKLMPSPLPYKRVMPRIATKTMNERYPELVNIPASKADVAYFYGCNSDLFSEPIADSFISIARHNNLTVSLPQQRCCGEAFAAYGNMKQYYKLARFNVDHLYDYKYIVAHCPSCLYGIKEYAHDFEKIGDTVYAGKAREIVKKLYDPGQLIGEVIGIDRLKKCEKRLDKKVTIHLSCHEKLGRKITAGRDYTRQVLKLIPGLEIVEMKGWDECCGLGGPWGLVGHYDLSRKMRKEKVTNIADAHPDIAVSWCFGCIIQMRDGLYQDLGVQTIETTHPLILLARAYAG